MAQDEMEQEGMDLGEDHAEPRAYELGFHIDAELPQEEAKKAYQAIKDLISANGTILAEGEAEKIQLAYTISRMETTGRRDFSSSYFGWIAYEATGEGHNAITEFAGSNKLIIRFIDLRTTKEGAKHSAEMHEFYRNSPEAMDGSASDEEAAADTELDVALKEAGVS